MSAVAGARPRLYAVGVGPGDPELITVRAARLLGRVPTVFHPQARAGGESLARAIAAPYLDPQRQALVPLVFPPRGAPASGVWDDLARGVTARLGSSGDEAALLTLGDPLLHSSFLRLAAALRRIAAGVDLEVVPGLPSFVAAAAAAALPLAQGGDRLAVLTPGADLAGCLRRFETVVVLKPSLDPAGVLAALEASGRLPDAVWVARCGLPGQRLLRGPACADALRARPVDYLSLLLVRG